MNLIKKAYIPFLFLACGLLIFFYPILFINNELMPGDLGDSRFINYVLEHGYLYLKGIEIHKSFWDMPFFYPDKNTLAYSDIMLGGMLIYTPIRFLCKSPFVSLQIWFFAVCLLNWLSSYILFKKTLGFNKLLSSFSAFLIAFSIVRYNHIYHLQLFTQFYMLFAFASFFALRKNNSKIKNNLLFLSGSICFVLQLYSSFYLGWYMVWGLVLSLLILIFFKKTRLKIFDFIKFFKIEIILYPIFILLLLIPLIVHYVSVGAQLEYLNLFLIKPWHIFKINNQIYSFFTNNFYMDKYSIDAVINKETTISIGIFATIFAFWGLYKDKSRIYTISFVVISLILFSFEPINHLMYNFFPGASAIRATGRIVFLLLPVYAFGICVLLKSFKNKILIASVIAIAVLEQIPIMSNYNFDWTISEHNARINSYSDIPKECSAVFYITRADNLRSPEFMYMLDVMWHASNQNKYLVNGYSGYFPMNKNISEIIPQNCILNIDNF